MLSEVPKTIVLTASGCVYVSARAYVFTLAFDPRRERASFHSSCLIRLSGPVAPSPVIRNIKLNINGLARDACH